jgi:hypothetical protein
MAGRARALYARQGALEVVVLRPPRDDGPLVSARFLQLMLVDGGMPTYAPTLVGAPSVAL